MSARRPSKTIGDEKLADPEASRRAAYAKAGSDFEIAIEKAAETMQVEDDPEDYDDAEIVAQVP